MLGPVFLALVLVILAHPVLGWLRRKGVPGWAASIGLLIMIYGFLLVIVGIIVLSVARLVTLLPTYASEASELLSGVSDFLTRQGIGPDPIRTMISSFDLASLARPLLAALSHLTSFGANVVFLMSVMLFMGLEASGAGSRLSALAAERPLVAASLRSFAGNTRRFLTVTTVFGLITGFADTLLLLWLDIPLAVLWGLLAFICNYIPYVGFVIGLVPPALLALLIGDWRLMLIVIVLYIVLNSLFTSLIQPYFVGDAVGVSMTITFIALVFWGWVLGPLGAILAIPLTLLVKAILVDADPRAGWAEAMIGSSRKYRPDQVIAEATPPKQDGEVKAEHPQPPLESAPPE